MISGGGAHCLVSALRKSRPFGTCECKCVTKNAGCVLILCDMISRVARQVL